MTHEQAEAIAEEIDEAREYLPHQKPTFEDMTAIILRHAGPEAQGWQGMDSAPKDGKAVLVTAGGYVRLAYWDDQKYNRKPHPLWEFVGPWGTTYARSCQPTGWMPLPAP